MKHTHSTTVQIDEVIAVTCDVCKRRYEEPTEIQGFREQNGQLWIDCYPPIFNRLYE